MEEVMDGNLKVRVGISNHDEIGQLQVSFNQMVEKLYLSIEDIKKYEKQKTHLKTHTAFHLSTQHSSRPLLILRPASPDFPVC